jgi:dihydroorotate dehydrogenase
MSARGTGRLGPVARTGLALAPRLLRLLPPETAHALALAAIRATPALPLVVPAGLGVTLASLRLAHPLGLAAGFDKNAVALAGLLRLGFAFVEAGGVTPRPQPGNPRPRVFRLAADRAIINRLGFNNDGLDRFVAAMARRPAGGPERGIVGVNLGVNKDSTDPSADYAEGARRLLPLADFVTVNVSSPNTEGLRDLQERQALGRVLEAVMGARAAAAAAGQRRPVFLKVAPDLDDGSARAIVDVAIERGVDALIVSNTTLARPAGLGSPNRNETGGLSGRPLLEPSTRLLGLMAAHAAGRIAFIGVGGIASGADAYAKIRNGATALQLYTALVYQGPGIIQRIVDELADCLAKDGFASVEAAVGAGLAKPPPAAAAG